MKLKADSRSRRQPNRRSRRSRRRRSRTYATAVPLTERLGGLLGSRPSSRRASARSLSGVASAGSRVLALLLALSMVGVLIWFFVDYRFFVYSVSVEGTDLVSAENVYQASALDELSVFYVNRMKAADRVRDTLTAIESASVKCVLPAHVQVRVRERVVAYQWHSGGYAHLVDEEGVVLGLDGSLDQDLIAIHDRDGGPLVAGDQIDADVLRAVRQLRALLPEARVFEYSGATGITLTAEQGMVIHFGDGRDVQTKVASMKALLGKIASAGDTAQFIDVRFVDSPYYR
jgi:cell division septal protein FtsQ